MQEPGFWDDQDRAAKVSAEHARVAAAARHVPLARVGHRRPRGARGDAATSRSRTSSTQQRASIEERLAELEEARLFAGRYDSGDAVVSVSAGAGGTDAQDWAEMLLRQEMRWAERRGFKVEMLEASPGEEAGLKSAAFIVRGDNAYGLFSAEKGVHRLVRISPFDASARRHTAFAQVEVSPLVEEAVDVDIDEGDLQIDTYRASGAGGQHVNKTDSAVRITHRPTGIVVQCQNERSQSSNKATAMNMLKSKLLELRGAEAPRGDREGEGRGAGRRLGLADPLVRPAPVHDGQGPPHEPRGRQRPGRARRRPRRVRARRAAAPGGRHERRIDC